MTQDKVNLHIDNIDDAFEFEGSFDFETEDELDFLDDGFTSGMPDSVEILIINANIATFDNAFGYSSRYPKNYGSLQDASIAINHGKIVWIGSNFSALDFIEGIANRNSHTQVYDAQWKWLTPGLIDCHTNLVYAGSRSEDFEARQGGVSYQQIADQGGGVLSTVMDTREVSEKELYKQSEVRLKAMLAEGVTTVEIKSGYGLNLETEEKILRVARQLANDYGVCVFKTYLVADTFPPEFTDDVDGYIEQVCQWMESLYSKGLIDAVETHDSNFSLKQISKIFDKAQSLNLPIKIQAEQYENKGASRLASEYRGLSSSHLDYISGSDIVRMETSDTVAVLLPSISYSLGLEIIPPIDKFRQYNVPIAISTSCNPGTSPMTSVLLAMNMACTLFKLTPAEALAGVKRQSSRWHGCRFSRLGY